MAGDHVERVHDCCSRGRASHRRDVPAPIVAPTRGCRPEAAETTTTLAVGAGAAGQRRRHCSRSGPGPYVFPPADPRWLLRRRWRPRPRPPRRRPAAVRPDHHVVDVDDLGPRGRRRFAAASPESARTASVRRRWFARESVAPAARVHRAGAHEDPGGRDHHPCC